jgi:hypothetical protein
MKSCSTPKSKTMLAGLRVNSVDANPRSDLVELNVSRQFERQPRRLQGCQAPIGVKP